MRGSTPARQTIEEERLATCARLFGEHPENAVAWAELCKAAVRYARSPRGKRVVTFKASGKPAGIRPRKNPPPPEPRPPVTT